MVKKSLPVLTQERWVWSLGGEDPLKKEIATCCSIFAWENPRDQSMESRRVGHDLATEHVHRDERGLCRMQRTEDAGEREGCEDRGEPQRDSATHIHVYILPQTPLPSRLPHNIEQSSMYLLYVRSLLVILFKYSSVYMSIPNWVAVGGGGGGIGGGGG